MALGKKAVFFTFVAVTFLSLLIFAAYIGNNYKMREKSFVIETRVETMDNFMYDLEEDASRGAYIAGFRALVAMSERVSSTGAYITNLNDTFKNLFLYGTFDGLSYSYNCSGGVCTFNNPCANTTVPGICIITNATIINVSCNRPSFYSVCTRTGLNCSNSTGGLSYSGGFNGCGYTDFLHMCEYRNATIKDCPVCNKTAACSDSVAYCNRLVTKNWYYCSESGPSGTWNMSDYEGYNFSTPALYSFYYGQKPSWKWNSWGYWDYYSDPGDPDEEHYFYCDNNEINDWRYGWGVKYCANNLSESAWESGCPSGWTQNKTINGTLPSRYTSCSWPDPRLQNSSLLMMNNTFTDWMSKMQQESQKIDLIINFIVNNISVYQEDPWYVTVAVNLTIKLNDKKNVASLQKTMTIFSRIELDNFEDPVYALGTNGLVSNRVIQKQVPYFVSGTDVTNLLNHTYGGNYVAFPKAPSYLMRLEGNFGSSAYGIESLVDISELTSKGISAKDKSIVDYIYFGTTDPVKYRVTGTPSWFKLDNSTNIYGNQTHHQLYQVTGLTS